MRTVTARCITRLPEFPEYGWLCSVPVHDAVSAALCSDKYTLACLSDWPTMSSVGDVHRSTGTVLFVSSAIERM